MEPGTKWKDWQVVRVIGQGSFGTVYEIRRNVFGAEERAALKHITIPRDNSETEEMISDGYTMADISQRYDGYLKGLVREYTLMSTLKGESNIVNCDDLEYKPRPEGVGWELFIRMELLTPLLKALDQYGSPDQAVQMGTDICQALVLCARQGIIHRDIKPQNIFVSRYGQYKLGDFGVAKVSERTTMGTRVGTFRYMAPEVYHDRPYGASADIYSLGMVMYWMLNRRRAPFVPLPPAVPTARQEEEAQVRRLHGAPLPPPADGSERLKRIVLKVCAYDPRDRYHDAASMLADLKALEGAASREPAPADDRTVFIPQQPHSSAARATPPGPAAQPVQKPAPAARPAPRSEPTPAPAPQPPQPAPVPPWLVDIEPIHRQPKPWLADSEDDQPPPKKTGGKRRAPVLAVCLVLAVAAVGLFFLRGGRDQTAEAAPTALSLTWDTIAGQPATIAAGYDHTAAIRSDGTVVAVGDNDSGRCDVDGWSDIVAVAAGSQHTVGLRADGTVVTTGNDPDVSGWSDIVTVAASHHYTVGLRAGGTVVTTDDDLDVSGWSGIVAVATGYQHTVGLRADGTVVAVGDNDNGQCDVSGWSGITAVAAGTYHTVGLRTDGTAVAAGLNDYGQCDVEGWTDIVAIAASWHHTVGLRADGTVVTAGDNNDGDCDVGGWSDIVAVAASTYQTVGLRSDGTVVAVGNNTSGQCDVDGWSDIRLPGAAAGTTAEETPALSMTAKDMALQLPSIAAGDNHTVALRSDGTVVAVGDNYYGPCDVDGWSGIRVPDSAGAPAGTVIAAGVRHTVAIRADGTVVAVGSNYERQCNVGGWSNIVSVAVGYYHTVGLRSDGTVVAAGWNDDGQCDVDGWSDIVAVAAGGGHTVGLRADGTVVAIGRNVDGRCNVDGWSDIVAVAAGDHYTIGLHSDGTVAAVGNNNDGQCDVDGWTDIVAMSGGRYHTVGLRSDGTVVAVGDNEYGQCGVDGWTDIIAVAAGTIHTVGLRADGTVIAAGNNDGGPCDVDGWSDIVAIAAGDHYTIGLRADGTVLAVGDNDRGKCAVDGWTDVVAVAGGRDHTVGLRADGTVVAAAGADDNGQNDVDDWSGIVAVAAGTWHTVGLRADGTVVAVGNNKYGQCDVDGWSDIAAVAAGLCHTVGLRAGGTVVAVGDNEYGQGGVDGWSDIVAVAAGTYHTVGLRSDGTVVAAGLNDHGQCDVDGWSDIVAVSAGIWHTVGLRADGTVVAAGYNSDGRCGVDSWSGIVAVAAGAWHTVGLRADGTVVATGDNGDGQCNVDGWTDIRLPDGAAAGTSSVPTPAPQDMAAGDSAALPAAGEPQTEFTVMGGQSALSPGYADNEVLNAMMDQAGIHITWDTMSGSLYEQATVRITSLDLPDAFQGVGFSNSDLTRYGSDGIFLDLTPYITPEIMPNLSAILEERPEIRAAVTMPDGGIYGLPAAERMGTAAIGKEEDYSIYTIPQFAMINQLWLDYLGLEVPTTLDELHDALAAFQEYDMSHICYGNEPGSTIPMSTGFDQWSWGQNIFYAGFGFTNWPNDVCGDLVLNSGGTVSFECASDRYRDAVTYFHDWYAEGLMDPETFSQSDTDLMAKCRQGCVGVSTWWEVDELMGDHADDYVFLPILTGPAGTAYEGTSGVTIRTGGAVSAGQLSITSACKDPAALLRFYDQWYTGEAVMQLQYGPIGVYFNEQDANGIWQPITDEEAQGRFGMDARDLRSTYEVRGPKLILSEYYADTFAMDDRARERLTGLYDFWMPYVQDTTVYPIDCVFTQEEQDVIDMYKSDFESFVIEQEFQWLRNGGPNDADWEIYKQMLSDCGMDRLLEVYQNAYDRYAAAMAG